LGRSPRTGKFPFIERKNLKRAAVVCHRNADADSYLSAVAISKLLKDYARGCSVVVATPEGVTTLTAKLAEKFAHETVEETDEDFDLYIAVDVGDAELLRSWRAKMEASRGVKVLVDHHPLRDRRLYDHVVVDDKATSAAEVVFRLFLERRAEIDRRTAQALLEAIMFDSSHLAIASPRALRAVVHLMDRGADVFEARKDLRSRPDYGEVLAKLKGAQRTRIVKVGEWVLATSRVGSYQAHVARALLSLGADVAVVGGESEGETKVSMRSTQGFLERSEVKLGTQVAEAVGKELGGFGGGHPTAASFSCTAGEEEAVKKAVEKLAGLLGAEAVDVT